MKFTTVLAFIAAATVVSASTNAERMARGLPPMPPAKRASPAEHARRSQPSYYHHKCNSGSLQCCKSVSKAGHGHHVDDVLNTLGLGVIFDQSVGVNCDSISLVGVGSGSHCTEQSVCCKDVHSTGLVALDCFPINLDL